MSLADLVPEEYRSPGLTSEELARAQGEAGAAFPEDLVDLLMSCLPTGQRFPDWRNEPALAMSRWRKQLAEGILFDVEVNGFWMGNWGRRPGETDEALSVVAEALERAPALIPIYGHRGIPNEPLEAGNPVFSVVQTDAIVYGVNLEDYLRHEFHGRRLRPVPAEERTIRFWTSLAVAA